MMKSIFKNVTRFADLLLTFAVVIWIEAIFTIEWSCPVCTTQSDGPSYAAFGMPFPYLQFGGISSLEYNFMPHLYLLNLIILCAIAFPIFRWVNLHYFNENKNRIWFFINIFSVVLIACRMIIIILLLFTRGFIPSKSIGTNGYESYIEFRPVGFSWNDGHYKCKLSHFWFPNKK